MAIFTQSLILVISTCLLSCAYRVGHGQLTSPGGSKKLSLPLFKNQTQEVGIEVAFTQALKQEFLRSKLVEIVDESKADSRLEGQVVSLQYIQESKRVSGDASAGSLPTGTVAAAEYRLFLTVDLQLIRRSDRQVVWSGRFESERTYAAPLVTVAGVNSANAPYNLSARRQILELIAHDMMIEAHQRMTENF